MKPAWQPDPMDVGLDRNKRHKRFSIPMPVWLEERLGLVIIVSSALMIALPLGILGSGATTVSTINATHIQIVYGPAKSWKAGSPTHLEAVTIKVKNTGPALAEGVAATASVRGQPIGLTGSTTIAVGATETYKGSADLNVVSSDVIVANIACTNCPDTPSGAGEN